MEFSAKYINDMISNVKFDNSRINDYWEAMEVIFESQLRFYDNDPIAVENDIIDNINTRGINFFVELFELLND